MSLLGKWLSPDGDKYNLVAPPGAGAWLLDGGLHVRAVTWNTGENGPPIRRCMILNSHGQSDSIAEVDLSALKVLRAELDDYTELTFTLERDDTITLAIVQPFPENGGARAPDTTVTLRRAT